MVLDGSEGDGQAGGVTSGLSAHQRGCRGRVDVRGPGRWSAVPGSGRGGADPRWQPRSIECAEVRHAVVDPAGDAAGGHDHPAWRQAGRLLRDLDAAVLPAGAARRVPDDDGVGVRRGEVGVEEGAAGPQRSLADDRGGMEPAGAGAVDQRPGRRERGLLAAPVAGRPDVALGEPAWRRCWPRLPADVHVDPRPLHGSGADGHACARLGRGG